MSRDIEAGGAVVRIKGKDQTKGELDSAKNRFMRFLSTVRAASAGFNSSLVSMLPSAGTVIGMLTGTGAGAGILGSLGMMAKGFANQGSQLADMQASTGMYAQQLGELAYGAQQSGGSIEALAGGLKGMAKFTYQLQQGGKGAVAVLNMLGISQTAFLAASPIERFHMIAEGLKGIEDPSVKAGLAMKVLGRSGSELLPMLKDGSAGLTAFAEEARRLRLPLTKEEVALADKLGDTYDQTTAQLQTFSSVIGAAVAPSILQLLSVIQPMISSGIDFVRANSQMIMTIAMIAAVVVTVGGMFLAAGVLIAGGAALVGAAIAGLGVIWAAATAVFFAIFSPMGLVIALVVALAAAVMYGIYAFMAYTTAGQALTAFIVGTFNDMFGVVSKTLGAVFDLLVAGNWSRAGEVMMLGLYATVEIGMVKLKMMWTAYRSWMQNLFADVGIGMVTALKASLETLVSMINSARTAVGLEEIKAGDIGGNLIDGMKAGMEAAKKVNADMAKAEQSVANARIAAAKIAVSNARKDAAVQRQNSVKAPPATKIDLPSFKGPNLGSTAGTEVGSVSIGTFSSAIAGLLGRSGTSPAERAAKASEKTAENTEEMKDLLEQMKEEGGLAFE